MSSSTADADAHLGEPFEMETRVRYCECDPMGVAHHSIYAVWLEMARCEMLRRDVVSYREMEEQGVFFVVARLAVRYRKPVRFDDLIRVRVFVTSAARVRLEHGYEIYRGQQLMATAETTLVCVNAQGKPQPMSDELIPQAER